MTTPLPSEPKRTFDVASGNQAQELSAAWQEIISGKRTRLNTAAEDVHEIMERTRTGLLRIVKAIEENPGTGQPGRLVRFLAGVYNSKGHYESKSFGGLLATEPSPDSDRPLVHARLLSESVAKPLCGATDGPWSARGFDFRRVTCYECQSLVLHPDDDSA
jgi:hypothetical protein